MVTSQRLIDLARSWLPALVASFVSLYRLGDLVYGFLQGPLRLVDVSLVLQPSISGKGTSSLLDASHLGLLLDAGPPAAIGTQEQQQNDDEKE
jgi:hypothetical protein